jgi:hypothetical protein
MANESGQVYGLTILSPIIEDQRLDIEHATQLRWYLGGLPREHDSPFAKVSSTYLARLVVLDDVVFVGKPACEEHLKSRYLIFETNFDGDLDTYLKRMATEVPTFVHEIWRHCEGYPGVENVDAFVTYMKKCQIKTTFYFADVNDHTVQQTLQALKTQSSLAHFMERNQGTPAAEVQKLFGEFLKRLETEPPPLPGDRRGDKSPAEDPAHD